MASLNYDYSSHFEDRPVHKISVYTNNEGFILIGFDKKRAVYSILHIKKSSSYVQNTIKLEEILTEDPEVKTEEQIVAFLKSKNDQVEFLCKAWAILGFIKLLQGYYMLLVTEAEAIAKIGNHRIYKVNFVAYIPCFVSSPLSSTTKNEKKYLQILKSFDLSTGFYFSDSYDLTNTFQTNVVSIVNADNPTYNFQKSYKVGHSPPINKYNDYFLWNYNLINEFYRLLRNKRWIIPFIYGYIEQIKIQKLLLSYQIILISRRSRHHAGTRYMTRGLNSNGFVGNFVETEQIVIDLNKGSLGNPVCSSFVQVRGSAPMYWFQETKAVTPKPPIHMNPSVDIYFEATKKHFADLYSLYGPTLFALNLIKKKEITKREQYLTEVYQQAIDYINLNIPNEVKIIYYHQDMKALLKKDKEEFLNVTNSFGLVCLAKIGFFLADISRKNKKLKPLTFQTGVIRSSCVDCLDRTNTFQQLLGESALSLQVAKIYDINAQDPHGELSLDDTTLNHFRAMFGRMGDVISLQYGGSIAHKTDFGNSNTPKQIEFFTSLKRYYSNTFTDQYKQSAINLFLGIHKPNIKQPPIWETPAPIIWTPSFEFLNQYVKKEAWWKKPIETFMSSITVNNDPEALNKALSQPPVVKIDVKNSYMESIQEDFDMNLVRSRKLSTLGEPDNSMRYDGGQLSDRIWLVPERSFDLAYELSNKNVNLASESDLVSQSMLVVQADSPELKELRRHFTLNKHSGAAKTQHSNSDFEFRADSIKQSIDQKKLLVDSKVDDDDSIVSVIPQNTTQIKSFTEEKYLTDLPKKLKKVYNHVLYIDGAYEEVEDRKNKESKGHGKLRAETQDFRKTVYPAPNPEDHRLYKDYCSFFKQNTDYMFNDAELKSSMIEEMKLGFDFRKLEREFEDYVHLEADDLETDEFPDKIKDYISPDLDDENVDAHQRLKSQGINLKSHRTFSNKTINDENILLTNQMYNLRLMKNLLTSIYPNLQRPNIMKA